MTRRRPDPLQVDNHPPGCVCRGFGWVCAEHPTQPWQIDGEDGCLCGELGMPCAGSRPNAAPGVGSNVVWLAASPGKNEAASRAAS